MTDDTEDSEKFYDGGDRLPLVFKAGYKSQVLEPLRKKHKKKSLSEIVRFAVELLRNETIPFDKLAGSDARTNSVLDSIGLVEVIEDPAIFDFEPFLLARGSVTIFHWDLRTFIGRRRILDALVERILANQMTTLVVPLAFSQELQEGVVDDDTGTAIVTIIKAVLSSAPQLRGDFAIRFIGVDEKAHAPKSFALLTAREVFTSVNYLGIDAQSAYRYEARPDGPSRFSPYNAHAHILAFEGDDHHGADLTTHFLELAIRQAGYGDLVERFHSIRSTPTRPRPAKPR